MIRFDGYDSSPNYYGYNVIKPYCACGNEDPRDILHYFYQETCNKESEFIGILCKRCDHEYLVASVLNPNQYTDEDEHLNLNEFKLFDCKLYRNKKEKPEDNCIFNADTYKPINDISHLKRGDHFALDRKLYTHHGIVNRIDIAGKQFEGIHYKKSSGRATIAKEMIKFEKERNVYRIDYDHSGRTACHNKLVIARASARIGDTEYNLLYDNCEHFSNFCKTGIRESSQTNLYLEWIKRTISQLLNEKNLNAACQFFHPLNKGDALKNIKYINAGIIIIVEGKSMIMEMKSIQCERNDGKMTLVEFIELSFSRIICGLIEIGIAVCTSFTGGNLGAYIARSISADGTFMNEQIGIFIGSIVGGMVGSLPERTLANTIGKFLGNILTHKFIAYDDCAVNDINDLDLGDHVVFHPGLHHPRCHGIVTGHNSVSHMMLIRSTYGQGVVEEEVKFTAPLYRVTYKEGESREIHEIIMRARSKLGTNEYNLLAFNCKHFAHWCKKR